MKKYFLPVIYFLPLASIKVKLQGTGSEFQVGFTSCAQNNTGCPVLRLDFGDLAAPPENYQLELTCSAGPGAGLSVIPMSTCEVTHVSGQIYDVNCCSINSGPCCPCAQENVLLQGTANAEDIEIAACCSCVPSSAVVPAGLNGCSGTTVVRILDGSGDTLSNAITPDECPSLQQN